MIADRDELAFWLVDAHGYTLGNFADGIGLMRTDVGGLWGLLSPELVEELKANEELTVDSYGPRMTGKGMQTLRRLTAQKWMA